MVTLTKTLLILIIFMVLNPNILTEAQLEVVCEKNEAAQVKCFNEKTELITNGGTVRRHERVLVKMEQIKGACSFQILEYRLVMIGPKSTNPNDDSDEVALTGKKYIGNDFHTEPYDVKDVGKTIFKIFPMSGKFKVADPVTCSFDVDYSKVVAVLAGGSETNYKPNMLTTIDASYSENTNEHVDKRKGLVFSWTCEIVKGDSKFCTDPNLPEFAGKNQITIPASESIPEYIYNVSVKVQIANVGNPVQYEDNTWQIVKFSELAAELRIQCIKNCKPKPETILSSVAVILKAVCLHCEKFISKVFFYWTVEDSKGSPFDYTKLKNGDRTAKTFYLKAGALKDDEVYKVKVETKENKENIEDKGHKEFSLSSETTLYTKLPPPLKNCTIDPPSGTAFKTGFEARCTYFPGDLTFEIYSVTDDKVVLLTKTSTLTGHLFYLPAGASVIINMTENSSGYTQTARVNLEVKEVLNLASQTSDEDKIAVVENKMDDIIELGQSGQHGFALQGLAAVVGEYSNMPPEKKSLELQMDHKAIKTISLINIDSPEQSKQAVDIVSQITEKYQNYPDPDLSLHGTAICHKASKILSAEANKIINPDLKRAQLTSNILSLASCSQAGLGQNPEAVEAQPPVVVMPTTEFPIIDTDLKLPEDYPDYKDDANASDNMAKFQEASRRMKNICFSNAKMIALTMVPEEDPVINVKSSISIASARGYCSDVPNTTIDNQGASLKPSSDCHRNSVIDILMCVVDKNPYWWKDNISMITGVAYTKFVKSKYSADPISRSALDEDVPDSAGDLDGFKDPFTITFKQNESLASEITQHQAVLPKQDISQLNEDSFYENVSTHRIYIFKNRGFSVTFPNMIDEEYYDIVLTELGKPTYKYFKEHVQTITKKNNVVHMSQAVSTYDTFWYLTLLPNKQMHSFEDKNYSFSVTSASCYTWNETEKAWVFACYAHQIHGYITCYCTKGNVFTGYVANNKVNLVEDITINFELEVHRCWIIFISTALAFFSFCAFLFFTSFEQKKDILDKIYFVGDVPRSFRYAYIIIVKTGNKRGAGTTSNIIMKLYGSNANSLEYVLNYPDPELVMLQRNTETWFVVATGEFLGEILKIEIWFDSVGNNTKWYCSKIEIYDIQENISWKFDIDKWFNVMLEERNLFVFTPKGDIPIDDVKEKQKGLIIRAVQSFLRKTADQVNLWNIKVTDPLLPLLERVSIIFSTVLTMFTTIMLLYNIPHFDPSDSIDENHFSFTNSKLIWIPILGSTIAFLIHFQIIFLLKKAKFRRVTKKIFSFLDSTENITAVCWIVITVISIICMTLLICCGFWVPMDTSLLWLMSVLLGMFFNAFVLNNISCVIYGYCLKLSVEEEAFYKIVNRIVGYVELQRMWLYKRFGELSLRPHLHHLYNRLDFITIKARIKAEKLKNQVVQILEDLIMIVIYVTLLYVVLMLDKEPMTVYSHKAVRNLATGKMIHSKMDTATISDIEDYLKKTLIPSVQALQWYGKYVQDNPGMTKDFCNKYMGIIRIRQHRTKDVPCDVPKIMQFLNMTCRPEFKREKEFRDFSRNWEPASKLLNNSLERMSRSWKYSNPSVTGTSEYFGELTIYPGGGYVSTLGRTIKNSLINLKYIQDNDWLDLRTRAIFIEFLTYNPNVNLFNTVKLVFEISASGAIESKIEMQTRKLLMVDNDQIFTKRVINVCFFIILTILSIRLVYKFIKKGRKFIYDLWSLFDVGIVILTVVAITLYYARLRSVKGYVNELTKAKNNEFVNYFYLFTADNILTSLTASLVFISTFRLWKLLRFMIIIQIAEKAIFDAKVPLLVCLVYQWTYIITFSVCGTLFFGADSKDFRDFHSSVTTLILLSINLFPDFNMDPIENHPLGIIYFSLYALFSIFFITMYIAIITLHYGDAKDFYSNEKGFVLQYLQHKWLYYKDLLKVRIKNLRGGADLGLDERVVKPRLGDRYENCMTIPKSRIRAMAYITMCVLRNEKEERKLTRKDFELMSKTIKALFEKESPEKDIFFITGDSQHIDLVDNRKLEEIADICDSLIIKSKHIIRESRKGEKTFFVYRIQRINELIANVDIMKRILDNVTIRNT